MTSAPARDAPERLLTIGAVCARLQDEFPDISISKIRYLEDQGLLTPKRTRGGYRLFGENDVERLETILRLQRDEFLPLRVIRQELSSPRGSARRRRAGRLTAREEEVDLATLCERAGIELELGRELEGFGLLQPLNGSGSDKRYRESDVDIALACAKLTRYGIMPRHLRTFRMAADREAALLEQLVVPALRSRNPERRQGALEQLQALAEPAQELAQRLFWRDLRELVSRA